MVESNGEERKLSCREVEPLETFRIEVKGIVQGVGFRPFVHRLVEKWGFTGWVRNTSYGAQLELTGERGAFLHFLDELENGSPPLARIESVQYEERAPREYEGFEILPSEAGERMETLVSPDVGICADCRRELFDPADRRFRYPFINCTNCGPRFTIIKSVPYDRASTSMASFPMCPDCEREFHDIRDRRYHAQPDCCAKCGPSCFYLDAAGREVPGDAIELARAGIRAGKIVCVKGLGGMHLACLPEPGIANELRRRKRRDEKPFALMCRNLDSARALCRVSAAEAEALESFRKPIVLLEKRDANSFKYLSENAYLGVMLPYTPLHLLLMGEDIDCLVMTSANVSETPIISDNAEALRELAGIADGFLLHNRDIQTKCDDSLIRIYEGRDYPLRRSRGYVPYPLTLPVKRRLLACGAEQKASFCLSKPGHVFPSQHMGDLKNAETLENWEGQIGHFAGLFDIEPEAIACDMHPDYLSTAYAEERAEAESLPLLRVQHHHAHMAACMADNGLDGECLGLVWDGTGYGSDGAIWGGELLAGGYADFRRAGSVRPIPLAGGDAAIEEPWRVGVSLLRESGLDTAGFEGESGYAAVLKMLETGTNCPRSSGMGRLFDGASAILGIKMRAGYEGQGAVLLEAAAAENEDGEYPFGLCESGGVLTLDWRETVRALCADGESAAVRAARFMNTLVSAAAEQLRRVSRETGLRRAVLSGGVFQNMYIMKRLPERLRREGLEVFTHSRVSCNDEGISLGQLMVLEASL